MPHLDDLASKVASLEARCQRLTRAAFILASVMVAAVLMAMRPAAGDQEIRTTALRLVDDEGVTRGLWTVGEDGGTAIRLYSEAGRVAAQLGSTKDASAVGLNLINAANTRMSGTTFSATDTGAQLALGDATGQMRSLLLVGKDDVTFSLLDSAMKPRAEMTVVEGGSSLRLESRSGAELLQVPAK